MTGIDIEVRAAGGQTTIALLGELDRAGCGALQDCIEVLAPEVRTVVLDLGALTFIDAAGIATLVAVRTQLDVDLRRLELASVCGQVRRVLEMTGADERLGLA